MPELQIKTNEYGQQVKRSIQLYYTRPLNATLEQRDTVEIGKKKNKLNGRNSKANLVYKNGQSG